MKLYFIRHSIALEREEWGKEDILRPLSKEGFEVAEEFFSKLPKIYKNLALIITSKATRGLQTAEVLRKYYPKSEYRENALLNPGMGVKDFRHLFDALEKNYESVAFVGHEPDFSNIISYIISCGKGDVMMKLKKPSVVEIELFDYSQMVGELRGFISPKTVKKL